MTATAAAAHTDPPHDRGTPSAGTDSVTLEVPPPERRAPVRHEALPTTATYPPLFAVLGAHGGAGASTLARWWAHAADTGRAWPAHPDTTRRVVLAARECLPGLTAAADRLREWHANLTPPGVQVIALVLTPARPGPPPRPVARFADTIAPLVDGVVYRIAWHEPLLECELDDLAVYTPGNPPTARRRRGRRHDLDPRERIPPDVVDTGIAITDRIAQNLTTATTPDPDGGPS